MAGTLLEALLKPGASACCLMHKRNHQNNEVMLTQNQNHQKGNPFLASSHVHHLLCGWKPNQKSESRGSACLTSAGIDKFLSGRTRIRSRSRSRIRSTSTPAGVDALLSGARRSTSRSRNRLRSTSDDSHISLSACGSHLYSVHPKGEQRATQKKRTGKSTRMQACESDASDAVGWTLDTNGTPLEWRDDLIGQRVVVVGLGASGRAAAQLALARGAAEVIAMDSKADVIPLEQDQEWIQECSNHMYGVLDISLVTDEGTDAEGGRNVVRAQGPGNRDSGTEGSEDERDAVASRRSLIGRVRTVLGTPHNEALLASASLVVLSPGVPPSLPCLALANSKGVPFLSELAFAYDALPPGILVAAVTGTNGKSTVTTFTGQILESCGIPAFVGGNLGTPLSHAALRCIANSKSQQHSTSSIAKTQLDSSSAPLRDPCPWKAIVAEVSSYQMELPGNFKPKAAVILNLTADHMERHKSMEAYGAAKCQMLQHMGPNDIAILPRDDTFLQTLAASSGGSPRTALLGSLPGALINDSYTEAYIQLPSIGHSAIQSSAAEVMHLDLSSLPLVGSHNFENAAAAVLLVLSLGVLPPSSSTRNSPSSQIRNDKDKSKVDQEDIPSSKGDQDILFSKGDQEDILLSKRHQEISWSSIIQRSLHSLAPPPHRMQLVRVDGEGVAWVNDSKATNVEATATALRGLSLPLPQQLLLRRDSTEHPTGSPPKVVLLLGGTAKVRSPNSIKEIELVGLDNGPSGCRGEPSSDASAKADNTEKAAAVYKTRSESTAIHSRGDMIPYLGFDQLIPLLREQRAVITFGKDGDVIATELESAFGRNKNNSSTSDATINLNSSDGANSNLNSSISDFSALDGGCSLYRETTFQRAVKRARELCLPGDCLLLSPGCASFDEFRNFEHRGDVFSDLAHRQEK